MRGGFKRLVNPGTFISEVDLEETREARRKVHEQFRLRQRLGELLEEHPVDDDQVQVTPYEVIEGDTDDTGDTAA